MIRYSTALLLASLTFLIICIQACDTPASEASIKENGDTYLSREMPVQQGMELFNQHCASCHDFSENGIGPNLSGITSKVDKQWLIDFIHNPPAMIESGDERAVQLFEKYQQYMPPFPMIKGEEMGLAIFRV